MDVVKQLAVQFVADMSGLNAGLARMDVAVDASTKRIKDKYGSLVNHMQTLGAKMSMAVTLPLIGAGAAALKFAASAQESENLFEVSMGNMAASARKWSQDTSKALGLNSYEVRKNVGTFNVMLNSMGLAEAKAYDMSKGMTKLAYDMASFYDLSNEEAFDKLRSGISGEMEPLKRLGILVDEETVKQYAYANGIANTGDKLTQQQKIMARYGSIMQQTSKAQGDLERTGGSFTNQLKRLQNQTTEVAIEFGKILIPAAQKLINVAMSAADWLKGLDDGERKAAIGAAVFAAALGPLALGVAKSITGFAALKAAVESFGWTMKSTFVAGGYVAAILALVAALGLLVKQMYDVTKGAEKMAQAQWKAAQQENIDQGRPDLEQIKRGQLKKRYNLRDNATIAALTEDQVQGYIDADPVLQRMIRDETIKQSKERRARMKAAAKDMPDFSVGADKPSGKVGRIKAGRVSSGGRDSAADYLREQKEEERQAAASLGLREALRGVTEADRLEIEARYQFRETMHQLQVEANKGADVGWRMLDAINAYEDARKATRKARADAKIEADKAARQAATDASHKAYSDTTEMQGLLADLEVQQLEAGGKKLEAAYKKAGADYTKTLREYALARAQGTMSAEKEHVLSDIAEGVYKSTTQNAYNAAKAEAEAARVAEAEKRKAALAHTRQLAGQVYERVQNARRGYNAMVKDAWDAAKRMAEASRDAVGFVSGGDIWKEAQLRRTRGSQSYVVPEPGYLNENGPATQQELLGASRAMLEENRNQTTALDDMVRALGNMLEPLRQMAGEGA